MEERLDWENWNPITEFENEKFDDEEKWRDLYEQAEDENQSRIEAIAKGLRLKKYDREMAYLYGYKVVEDILKKEYEDIWNKSNYSKGRIQNGILPDAKKAFKRANESEELLEHVEALENEVDRLDEFSKKEMMDTLLEESGFYKK